MKGMDSSESQSDEDETPNTIGSKAATPAQPQAKRDEFTQDMDPEFGAADASRGSFHDQLKQYDIKHSSRKSSFQKFIDHSKRAIKKTVASFICLSFLLLISFVVSTYEYNEVHGQYQRVYDDVAKRLGRHPEAGRNASLLHSTNTKHVHHNQSTAGLASTELADDMHEETVSHSAKMKKPKAHKVDVSLAQTGSEAGDSDK